MTKRPRKVVKSSRDSYLQKRFGITESEYNQQLEAQGGGCIICGSTPKTRSLHVDHDHKIESWKIISKKEDGVWISFPQNGKGKLAFVESARLKQESRAKVKARLKRLSVRGIICFPDNVALRKFSDEPIRLKAAAKYIEEYQNYVNTSNTTRFND